LPRVLLFATTTGYQTRAFGDAAERLGVELVFATDRCDQIDDPWRDGAIAIRFHEEERSVAAVVEYARSRPIDGILAVGDRPTYIASSVAAALGIPGHNPQAVAIARHKLLTRERLRERGLPVPAFVKCDATGPIPKRLPAPLQFPCVVKPVALSGSRGVMRVDDGASLASAFDRVRRLLASPDIRAERNTAHDTVLVESFISGREYAIEALLHHGDFRVIAIFDKPDPLDGPFFEETIYLTPPSASAADRDRIISAVSEAAFAIGLNHGPIHAECRVNKEGVFVLEVAARPIGGLCARVLTLAQADDPSRTISFEEFLLRHCLGESPQLWTRETSASGVMMIPIPRRGILRSVEGIDAAKRIEYVADVQITAKPEQTLVPLPEGASYLGFIFARSPEAATVDRALREAHAALEFRIDPELPVINRTQTRYNHAHG
jgi:formate-dependent phosphoribosylglycinamide formyltransferase (GAR transformylase)